MDPARFRDLAIEHLLGELAGSERLEFLAELERRGAEGERELARMREAVGGIALAATPVDPPKALRARLLAEIETEAAEDRTVVSLRPWLGRWGVAAAGIAAALAFVFGIRSVELQNRLGGMQASLDSARTALSRADTEVAAADSLRRALDDARSALGIAALGGASSVTLSGTDEQPLASARAFIDPATGRTLLVVRDLPVLPPDVVYQLWAIRDGAPAPAGTFTVGADGSGRLEAEEADLWIAADVLAVTVEPAPGQPAPTGPIVLAGSL